MHGDMHDDMHGDTQNQTKAIRLNQYRSAWSSIMIGMQEILIILLIGLVLFGSKKLPEIGGGLGRAIRNFKKATSEPDEIDITPKAESKKTEGSDKTA